MYANSIFIHFNAYTKGWTSGPLLGPPLVLLWLAPHRSCINHCKNDYKLVASYDQRLIECI